MKRKLKFCYHKVTASTPSIQWSSSSSSSKSIPDDAIPQGKNNNQPQYQRTQNDDMREKRKWNGRSSGSEKNRPSHRLSQSRIQNDLFIEELAALSEVCQNIELKVY